MVPLHRQVQIKTPIFLSVFRVAVVICSGNLELHLLQQCIAHALTLDNRVCRFSLVISDCPGDMSKLLEILAREEAR